ncbi:MULTISPECIES: hypothetical protein [Thiomicrorhabdus]|uniref:Uncharacterized protein n=1 Tax=Thiomicrorhabdus heinhorstiae TaxID=2748010 RepID=A0ABS0BYK8_9GAMM|nr:MULTISPECIES: hypothetical protein [Thiomicrorhabdus]MBF6058079.1 hypothetical protein [Thiomicrorhabdus heinhorstiae]
MFEKNSNDYIAEFTPLEKAEALFDELVKWYGDAEKKEIRAAAKLLIVSLEKFSVYGGHQWSSLVMEYVNTLKYDPEKFQKIIESNRGELKNKTTDLIQ